jgi:rod shape-determining protein MreD
LDYIKIYNIKPNLLIVFVVSVALLRGNVEGAVAGFLVGLSQDITSGKILGLYSLLGLYLGLIMGSVNKRLYRDNFLVVIFFTFVSTGVYELVVYSIGMFTKGYTDLLFSLRWIILPEAIYNSIISLFVYAVVIKLNEKFESVDKSVRKY